KLELIARRTVPLRPLALRKMPFNLRDGPLSNFAQGRSAQEVDRADAFAKAPLLKCCGHPTRELVVKLRFDEVLGQVKVMRVVEDRSARNVPQVLEKFRKVPRSSSRE